MRRTQENFSLLNGISAITAVIVDETIFREGIMEIFAEAGFPEASSIRILDVNISPASFKIRINPIGAISDSEDKVVSCYLSNYPHCCGSAIIHNLQSGYDICGKGWASKLLAFLEQISWEMGFSNLTCVVRMEPHIGEGLWDEAYKATTEKTLHLLEKFGWVQINEFTSKRTKAKLGLFSKNLI